MAMGNFFGNLKDKVRTAYNNFFYEGEEAPAPQMVQEDLYPAPDQQPYAQQPQTAYQSPYGYAAQPQPYQQPQPQGYPSQPGYQQPAGNYAAPAQQSVYQPPVRNRRMQQHAAQQENNVVDFGAYQQQAQGYQQPQQAYQQPQQPQTYQTQQAPYQQPAPQEMQPQPQMPSAGSTRIINARGMGDCRSAITLLRNGDAVLIVLENVTDPAEMRRLVDTLSGACYSLTATITKVSRYGVYLLAPQTVAVYADQATSQMNSAPQRTAMRGYQPGYGAQRPVYQPQQQAAPQMQQPVQQQPAPQAPVNAYAPQQGFAQRTAAPEEAAQPFYAREAAPAAQAPAFAPQPAGYGYAPDENMAVAE